jgi:hypothetical protein
MALQLAICIYIYIYIYIYTYIHTYIHICLYVCKHWMLSWHRLCIVAPEMYSCSPHYQLERSRPDHDENPDWHILIHITRNWPMIRNTATHVSVQVSRYVDWHIAFVCRCTNATRPTRIGRPLWPAWLILCVGQTYWAFYRIRVPLPSLVSQLPQPWPDRHAVTHFYLFRSLREAWPAGCAVPGISMWINCARAELCLLACAWWLDHEDDFQSHHQTRVLFWSMDAVPMTLVVTPPWLRTLKDADQSLGRMHHSRKGCKTIVTVTCGAQCPCEPSGQSFSGHDRRSFVPEKPQARVCAILCRLCTPAWVREVQGFCGRQSIFVFGPNVLISSFGLQSPRLTLMSGSRPQPQTRSSWHADG